MIQFGDNGSTFNRRPVMDLFLAKLNGEADSHGGERGNKIADNDVESHSPLQGDGCEMHCRRDGAYDDSTKNR